MRGRRWMGVGLVAVALAAGCGGGGDADTAVRPIESTTSSAPPSTVATTSTTATTALGTTIAVSATTVPPPPPAPPTTPVVVPTTTPVPPPQPPSGPRTVTIADYAYAPDPVEVRAGSTVTWTNDDGVPHTATDASGGWDTGSLAQGQSASVRFDTPGTYAYVCSLHPTMRGRVVVR